MRSGSSSRVRLKEKAKDSKGSRGSLKEKENNRKEASENVFKDTKDKFNNKVNIKENLKEIERIQ